jgi:hypothetical protein
LIIRWTGAGGAGGAAVAALANAKKLPTTAVIAIHRIRLMRQRYGQRRRIGRAGFRR